MRKMKSGYLMKNEFPHAVFATAMTSQNVHRSSTLSSPIVRQVLVTIGEPSTGTGRGHFHMFTPQKVIDMKTLVETMDSKQSVTSGGVLLSVIIQAEAHKSLPYRH